MEGYKFDPEQLSETDKALFFGLSNVTDKEARQNLRKVVVEEMVKTQTKVRTYGIEDPIQDQYTETGCCKCWIIRYDFIFKKIFDIIIQVFLVYSCVSTAYLIAYDRNLDIYDGSHTWFVVLNTIVEVFFLFDIITRFMTSYYDYELARPVTKWTKIASRYACTWFTVDLQAIIPFWLFINGGNATKIIRILRLPKAMALFEISKFEAQMDFILENCYKKRDNSRHDAMRLKYISVYIYKIVKLIIVALLLTYFLACLWYFLSETNFFQYDCDSTFAQLADVNKGNGFQKLVVTCYFTLTTLATVGYGDQTPQNNFEKIICIFLMIVGIAFFSYIMGNFNDVLINYDRKMGVVDHGSDLQVWLTSLSKFTSQKPLPRSLVKKIDQHFRFYWKNDRLCSVDSDDPYLKLMPKQLRFELVTYLFDDVYQTFRAFFQRKEFFDSFFFYDIGFFQLPRKVEAGEIMLNQGDEINQIYFIMDGEIVIEFEYNCGTPVTSAQLYDKDFQRSNVDGQIWMKLNRYYGKGYYFGDYNCLIDKPSAFTIKSSTPLFIYTIPKLKFLSLSSKYKIIIDRITSNSEKNYKSCVANQKEVMHNDISKSHNIEKTELEIDTIWQTYVTDFATHLKTERHKKKNRDFLNMEFEIGGDGDDNKGLTNQENNDRLKNIKKHREELENISKKIDKLKSVLEYQIK